MLFWIYHPDFEQRCLMYYTKLYIYIWVNLSLNILRMENKSKDLNLLLFHRFFTLVFE